MVASIHECIDTLPRECFRPDMTWALKIDTFCRSMTAENKNKLVKKLLFLPFSGPVKVNKICSWLNYAFLLLFFHSTLIQ